MEHSLFSLRSLSFSYPDGKRVFTNLDLDQKGSVLLCGENGSGKSTLLKLLAGLLKPQSGKLLFQERELPGRTPQSQIYYLSQNFSEDLIGITPREDLALWKLSPERIDPDLAISTFGLADICEQPVYQLSRGEQRLLSLTPAPWLMNRFWLWDEPLAGLDAANRQKVIDLIKAKIMLDRQIIISMHQTRELCPLFDHIWHLQNGCISEKS